MDEIMKMIRFDFLTVRPITFKPFVIICGVICLLSILICPLAAILIPVFAVMMFNPIQTIADKSGFNRFYGITPVKKSSMVWARFGELVLSLFAGEMLSLFVGYASWTAMVYVIFPYPFTEISEPLMTMSNSGQFLLFFVSFCLFMFVFSSILVCLFTMAALIAGQENEMTFVGIFLLLILVLAIAFAYMLNHGMIAFDYEAIMAVFIPENIMHWIGGIFVYHFLTFGICALMGHITIKVLDKREL